MQNVDISLIRDLGVDVLAYLLGVQSEVLTSAVDGDGAVQLSAPQLLVLNALENEKEVIDSSNTPADFRSMRWSEYLLQSTEDTTLACVFHRFAIEVDGESMTRDSATLEDCLSAMITDFYAGLALPASAMFGMNVYQNLSSAYYRHPLRETFEGLAMRDRDLKLLFSEATEDAGLRGRTMRSTGQGGTIQLSMLAQELIGAGLKLAKFERSLLSPERVAQDAVRSLGIIRAAIRGDDVSIPVRVGLTGVLLPDEQPNLDFGWAHLRRADGRDTHLWASTSLEQAGTLTTTTEQGETIEISYRGDLVLEFEAPYKLVIGERDFLEEWPDEMAAVWDRFNEISENVRLGLLLAEPDQRTFIVTTWQSVFDPISHANGTRWYDPKVTPNLLPRRLKPDGAVRWASWSRAVGDHRVPTIGVAIRRMLMAVAERRNPEDVLVDAVVVWENLFGARSDTTLRIASSLALLLSPEDASVAERLKNQKSYKDLYRLRSEVVHGAPKIDLKKLQQGANDAVEISIAALCEMFGGQSDLLAIKTSEERSLHVIHRGDRRTRTEEPIS